jgi:DNA modification methylase
MKSVPLQPSLFDFTTKETAFGANQPKYNGLLNKLDPQDRPFHDWYRFVLSYPPHLVREYLSDFQLKTGQVVFDPFCGTGTTIVEARRQGFAGIGVEANPMAQFASAVKVNWEVDPGELLSLARETAEIALRLLHAQGIEDLERYTGALDQLPLRSLDPKSARLLITNSISPLPLHKSLTLLDCLNEAQGHPAYAHARLAFASALVYSISNLRFGPEVGVSSKIKVDTPVIAAWLAEVQKMARDLRLVAGKGFPEAIIHLADARDLRRVVSPGTIGAVITSPPYPNEKDYTRTTRLESVLLGFIKNKAELRAYKKSLVRSNTRSVYKADRDDLWVEKHAEIQRIAAEIEQRRIELGKTSGFEKLYSQVTRQYFGGMARHFNELRSVLQPGAHLAYVVGDQASYLRVMIRTGQLLADLAKEQGYEVLRIDLFRTRFATATKEELREEVVVLRWPG